MRTLLTGTAIVAILAATPLGAQATSADGNTFDWSGGIPAGGWLRVRNLNGSVEVLPADGDQASVHGVKQWHGDADPARVRFLVEKQSDGVTICAVWHDDDTCEEQGHHHDDNDHNNTSVRFTVRLPAGVKIAAGTVNGSVSVDGATSEVRAHTVNGGVDAVSSGGPVAASTVNGDVTVRMHKLPSDGDLDYSTVNGSVSLELPADLDATVEMETVNGSVSTDFPITIQGRLEHRRLRGQVGSGSHPLSIRLRTVNGSIALRKVAAG